MPDRSLIPRRRAKLSLAFVVLAALLLVSCVRIAVYFRSASFEAEEAVVSCLQTVIQRTEDATVESMDRRMLPANRLGFAASDDLCRLETVILAIAPDGMKLAVSVAHCGDSGAHYRGFLAYKKKTTPDDIAEARAFLERLEQGAAARCDAPRLLDGVIETCQNAALCGLQTN